jgi:hypothetical protein
MPTHRGAMVILVLNLGLLLPLASNPKVGQVSQPLRYCDTKLIKRIVHDRPHELLLGLTGYPLVYHSESKKRSKSTKRCTLVVNRLDPDLQSSKGIQKITVSGSVLPRLSLSVLYCSLFERLQLTRLRSYTFVFLGAFFLLADGLNTTGSMVGIVQNAHFQFSFLQSTYLTLVSAFCSIFSCYAFWYLQRYKKISTKKMFIVTNCVTVSRLFPRIAHYFRKCFASSLSILSFFVPLRSSPHPLKHLFVPKHTCSPFQLAFPPVRPKIILVLGAPADLPRSSSHSGVC